MILLLAICPESCKCKKGSDWLKKLADANTIFKSKVNNKHMENKSYLFNRNIIILEDFENASSLLNHLFLTK